MRKIHTL